MALPRMSRTGCAFDGGRRDRRAYTPTPRTQRAAARGLRKGARGGPGIAASTIAGRSGLGDGFGSIEKVLQGCCLKGGLGRKPINHGNPWTIYDHLCSSIVHKCHQHFFFAVLRLILTLRPEGQANPGAFCRPKISNAVAAKVYWTTHIKPSICVMASGAQSELLSSHDRPTSL